MRRPGAVIRVQGEAAAVFSSAWQGSSSLQHVRKSCRWMETHNQLQHAASVSDPGAAGKLPQTAAGISLHCMQARRQLNRTF